MKKGLLLLLLYVLSLGMMAQNVIRVAMGGNTKDYAFIHEAVADANAATEAMMTLLDDVIIEEPIEVKSKMTLDLNGKMLGSEANCILRLTDKNANIVLRDGSGTGEGCLWQEAEETANCVIVEAGNLFFESGLIYTKAFSEYCTAVRVAPEGYFCMTGGKIDSSSESGPNGLVIRGRCDIKGGEITVTASGSYCYGIYVGNNASLKMTGGKMNVTSGFSYCYGIYMDGGNLKMNGGQVKTNSFEIGYSLHLASERPMVEINSGGLNSVTTYGAYADFSYVTKHPNITITGGYFGNEADITNFSNGKYVIPVAADSKEYAEGYRFTISDTPQAVAYARNITSGKDYDVLEIAMREAVKGDTISLTKDYTLEKNLTIPDGVVFLIPFDAYNTCKTSEPNSAYPHTEEYVYRTLTVADGIRINVDGEMVVGATQTSEVGGHWNGAGSAYAGHGLVKLGNNAVINTNGKLYCWGYICGKGEVIINNGATLYESLQIIDWRGGTVSSEIENKVYPFNQYYVQNIESKLTLMYGAKERLGTDLYFQLERHRIDNIEYVATNGEGMFCMQEGSRIERQYDGATDRMRYTLSGAITLGGITIDYGGMDMNSRYYTYPLNGNITIDVISGTFTLTHNYSLQAGFQMNVKRGAFLEVGENCTLYMYDREDWSCYAAMGYVFPLEYTIANGHNNRTVRWGSIDTGNDAASYEKVSNTTIMVEGEMMIDGNVMTSLHGDALLRRSNNGIVMFRNATGKETDITYQCVNHTSNLVEVSMRKANVVLNGDANGDNAVTMADANMVVNACLGLGTSGCNSKAADTNGDGKLTMADANSIVNITLGINE